MKRLGIIVVAAAMLAGFATAPVMAQEADTKQTGVFGACDGQESAICSDKTEATDVVKRVINLMLYVIGILSVIMIIHSGLKYTASRGDAEMIKSAKNTLLYAVTGLIVAMLAFTIVNFVVGAFNKEPPVQGPPAPAQAPVQGPPAP